jgi:cytoskeletal protein RodZ
MAHHDPMDQLVRKAHERSPGAPAGFAARLHADFSAEQTRRKRLRRIYIQSAVAVAAVLILALTIGLNPQWFVSAPAQPDTEPQPQAKSVPQEKSTPQDRPWPKVNAPEQKPEPQPEAPGNSASPTPEPEPTPERPEPLIEPLPEPEKPDDAAEQPLPEPSSRDDVVEKPQPKEPEDTAPVPDKPAERVVVATLASTEAKLEVRYGDEPWRDWAGGESLYSGVHLRAGRVAIDAMLAGGGIARFDGEVSLVSVAATMVCDLREDSVYIDNLGTGNAVTIATEGHEVAMPDGACFVIVDRNGTEAACMHGSLTIDGSTVEPGTYRKATARGVGDARTFKGDSMLKKLPARVILREDFDVAPPGGMYEEGERLENGVVVMDKAPRYIAFRYNPTLAVLPGTVLRMRVRATDVSKLELELFTAVDLKLLRRNEELLFKHIWSPGDDEWQEIELRLEDIALKDNPERKIIPGDLLRNFKLHYQGKKLEIDWVEFVRVQE